MYLLILGFSEPFRMRNVLFFIKHASLRISLFRSLFDLNDDTVTLMRNN